MSNTTNILKSTEALLEEAVGEEDPLLQVLCRYKAHGVFATLKGAPELAAAEVYWPVLRVLEKPSRVYTKDQLQLVLETLRTVRENPSQEREAMLLVSDLEDAGLPVNPPLARALTELISNLELDPED